MYAYTCIYICICMIIYVCNWTNIWLKVLDLQVKLMCIYIYIYICKLVGVWRVLLCWFILTIDLHSNYHHMCVTIQKPTPGNFQCQAFHGPKSSAILFEPSTEPILNNTILFPCDYARIHELEQSMNYKCNMQYIYIYIDRHVYTPCDVYI